MTVLKRISDQIESNTNILMKYFFPPALIGLSILHALNNQHVLALMYGVLFVVSIIAVIAVDGRKRGKF